MAKECMLYTAFSWKKMSSWYFEDGYTTKGEKTLLHILNPDGSGVGYIKNWTFYYDNKKYKAKFDKRLIIEATSGDVIEIEHGFKGDPAGAGRLFYNKDKIGMLIVPAFSLNLMLGGFNCWLKLIYDERTIDDALAHGILLLWHLVADW